MPVQAFNQLTFSGTLGQPEATVEDWSWRLRFPQIGEVNSPDLTDESATAAIARTAWGTHLAGLHPVFVQLRNVRYSRHVAGGATAQSAGGGYTQADDETVVGGVHSATVRKNPQTSLVVSLMTTRAGSTGRGRVFLPQVGFPLGIDMRLSIATAQQVATAFRDFLNALNTTGGPGAAAVISSKGYQTTVSAVRVGLVEDTLRSRRRDLLEEYQVVAL